MSKKRKSGTGLVRLRSDGRWEGRHVIGYDEKGLPKTKSVLAKTKKECVAKLKALQENIVPTANSKLKPDMKFGDWLTIWHEQYSVPRLSPSTQESQERLLRLHIIPELGAYKLDKLSTNDLQQFYAHLKQSGRKQLTEYYGEGLSDRTIRTCHAICHKALAQAVDQHLIRKNPAEDCRLPPKNSHEMQVLTREEMGRFLIQAKYEGYYELYLLALATGLRRGELLGLQWSDVTWETGAIRVEKQVLRIQGELIVAPPKTNASNRTIILPESVLTVLEQLHTHTKSQWIFPSPVKEDAPMDPNWCLKKMHRILEHAQCKRVRFHDLRHTFATNAIAGGMDVKTLSTVIGHVSAATTLDIYAHSTEAMQKAASLHIDQGITHQAPPPQPPKEAQPSAPFQPHKGKKRKPGTGGLTQITPTLWEGRYAPVGTDGKRHVQTVYAKTEAECEMLLADLIARHKIHGR
ncbi:site-specific integrase [Bengtsoniella intestinalis]|uniref:tyrosine-type recombinase/integrase n=1 Tax=Bengtsoniella intestinalis TaxID=3073143 RepID=UPI00391F7F74